nr:hypothetical protein [Tanacetum cinerariifolium]
MFKGHGTVFDIYMVKKRLRSRKKYGFVRFKNIIDVDFLYKRLCLITFYNKQRLMIFLAHNRKFGTGGEKYTSNNMNKEWAKVRDKDGRRTKLWNIEVKYMGGLEVMVVLESEEAVKNVIENIDHGIRRVPIVCWKERVFKLISSRWGDIMEFLNCNLNRSHGVIAGRVLIHTWEAKLITSKELYVKIGRNKCKVLVKEEVRDIMQFNIANPSVKPMEEDTHMSKPMKDDGDVHVVKNPNESYSCDDNEDEDSDDEVVKETAEIRGAQGPRKFNDVREKVRSSNGRPILPSPVAPAGQHVAPEILEAHNAWIKGSKEIVGLMLMTIEPDI